MLRLLLLGEAAAGLHEDGDEKEGDVSSEAPNGARVGASAAARASPRTPEPAARAAPAAEAALVEAGILDGVTVTGGILVGGASLLGGVGETALLRADHNAHRECAALLRAQLARQLAVRVRVRCAECAL